MAILNQLTNNVDAPENWVGSTPSIGSGVDAPENWVDAQTESRTETPYDAFKASKPQQGVMGESTGDRSSNEPLRAAEGTSKKEYNINVNPTGKTLPNVDYPHENFLNATLHLAEGAVWKTLGAPFQKEKSPDMDQYLDQLEKKHPIANFVGGTAPFIAAAPFVPETLVPGIYARYAVQFGLIGLTSSIGRAKFEDRSLLEKSKDVALETAKQASFGPLFAKAHLLEILERPFLTALTRAGVVGIGSTTLSTFFGDNITQAFKQGGILTALSLITEAPHLGSTVIGRGLNSHVNGLINDIAIKAGYPNNMTDVPKYVLGADGKPLHLDPASPTYQDDVNKVTEGLAKQIPGMDKPQIVSATVKLADGTEIHGSSHEDALNKIGLTQSKGLPLFKSSDAAILYGDQVKGNKLKANEIRERKEDTEKKLDDLKKIESPTAQQEQEMMDLSVKRSFDRESLKRAEGTETEAEKKSSDKILANQHKEGFTVLDPDGTTKFITRDEAMKEPFNIKDGVSENVPGLNESKFLSKEPDLKIVNPETLGRIKNNEGKVNINLVLGRAEAAELLQRSYKELKETFIPPDVSEPAKFTAMSMRQWLGINALNRDRFFDSMLKARDLFERADKRSIIDTYTKAQRGEKQDTVELQKIYDTLQAVLKDKAEEVQNETGRLQELIENYLPQAWEDPKRAGNLLQKIFGKKPFEGPKSFLKKRSINDFEEGIKAGLTPISWNPVDLTMFKLTEMDKFLMAHRVKNALKERQFRVYVPIGGEAPEGWKVVNDNAEKVYKNPMIAVKEAFDKKMMEGLEKVARDLGIDVETKMKLRGGKALGLSKRGEPAPGQISDDPLMNTSFDLAKGGRATRSFATPESVLAHEIGHQLDEMYGLKEKFVNEKYFKKELRALSDALYEGEDASPYFKKYVRRGSEKMAHMLEAYIHAPDKFKEVAPKTFNAFEEFLNRRPELKPLTEIKPSLVMGTRKGEIYAGGIVQAGTWYTHPDAARIIDNYLSPGLRGKYFYDLSRVASNSMIQARMSLSAFHGTFVSNDSNISNFALGLNQLSRGNVKGAFTNMAESLLGPIGPIHTLLEGRKVMESWNGKDNGPLTNMIAEYYARGGARAKMDRFYAIEADKAISKALKEGKLLTGALHTPFWILQQLNRPLLEYYVPRMKMGVFSNLIKFELERNPNITETELLGKAQKAVDAVDDRMGQLVYDNLFINKTLKDLGFVSVQSLGWNIGDVRLFGGGTVDLVKNLNDLRQGKSTELSYRLAYVLAMPIVMGYYGAIYQYLHTGKKPGEGIEEEGLGGRIKDLFFPRNGAIDPRGQEARVSLPSYTKDVYHFAEDPLQTVLNKLNPLPNEILSIFNNKDFYGTKIYNEDDPLMQQFLDSLSYVVQSNLPFSIQSAQKDTRHGILPRVESFFGINTAPYDINMTSAEKLAYKLDKGHIPVGSRTKKQAKHSKDKAKVRSDFMSSKDEKVVDQAVEGKVISKNESKEIKKEGKMTNLERLTRHATFEEVFHILKKGNPNQKEKEELESILDKKRQGKQKRGAWTSSEENLYDKNFASQN